jgi:F0F1-type ATP synthase alpha subunit
LDDLAIDKVLPFEKLLYQKMDTSHISLSETIIKEESLTENIEKEIEKLIKETYEETTLI